MASPPLHPDLAPLGGLVGDWAGQGRGDYPTIEAFAYEERTSFWHVGKPFLFYMQRTWALKDGQPLHSEMGYLRPAGANGIELVASHPFGVVEISEGSIADGTIELRSTTLTPTSTSDPIDEVVRKLTFSADRLAYGFEMATGGRPLQFHLEATLQRVESPA